MTTTPQSNAFSSLVAASAVGLTLSCAGHRPMASAPRPVHADSLSVAQPMGTVESQLLPGWMARVLGIPGRVLVLAAGDASLSQRLSCDLPVPGYVRGWLVGRLWVKGRIPKDIALVGSTVELVVKAIPGDNEATFIESVATDADASFEFRSVPYNGQATIYVIDSRTASGRVVYDSGDPTQLAAGCLSPTVEHQVPLVRLNDIEAG